MGRSTSPHGGREKEATMSLSLSQPHHPNDRPLVAHRPAMTSLKVYLEYSRIAFIACRVGSNLVRGLGAWQVSLLSEAKSNTISKDFYVSKTFSSDF